MIGKILFNKIFLGISVFTFFLMPMTAGASTLDECRSANIDWAQFKGEEITVCFTSHPWQEQLCPLIPEFEELTGIKVKLGPFYPTMEYRSKRAMEVMAGTWKWDVYMLCPIGFGPLFAKEGWAEPLDKYIADSKLTDTTWYDYEDIFGSARKFTLSDGKYHYQLPITAEAQVLFYRKDLLAALGLAVPKTMDELFETARKLTKAPTQYGLTLRGRIDSNWWPLHGFLKSYGGGWFDWSWEPIINTPASVAAVDMYGKLGRQFCPLGLIDYCFDEIGTSIAVGKAAMYLDASVAYPRFQDPKKSVVQGKIGTAVMPAGPAGSRPDVHFWGVAMNSVSKKKEASWLFLQWATSRPIQKQLAIAGIAPPRASTWQDPEFTGTQPEDFVEGVSESLKIGSYGPLHVKFAAIQHVLTVELQNVLTGSKTAQQACDDVASAWGEILAK